MEANEPAEMISAIEEERHHHETEKEKFRNYAAVWVAILAAMMAVRGVGAEQAKDDMIAKNIQASDTWAQYQAKNMRQTIYKVAVDQLGQDLKTPGLSADAKATAEKRLDGYQKTIKRYDSEPLKANDPLSGGKAEIAQRARGYETERERLEIQNHNFNLAEMFYQLGLVLASVSILIASRKLLAGSLVLGALGAALTLNGFFLLVDAIG